VRLFFSSLASSSSLLTTCSGKFASAMTCESLCFARAISPRKSVPPLSLMLWISSSCFKRSLQRFVSFGEDSSLEQQMICNLHRATKFSLLVQKPGYLVVACCRFVVEWTENFLCDLHALSMEHECGVQLALVDEDISQSPECPCASITRS
jgi:hypothetical protein